MRLSYIIIACFSLLVSLQNNGCVSTEETGAGDRAKTPLQILGPVDTTRRMIRHVVVSDTMLKHKIDSTKVVNRKPDRKPPKFKSQEDTLQASILTKKKSNVHLNIKIDRPEHPFYTVQIGAFTQATNALRAHKRAKEIFTNQPVFNNYVKSAKIYRVSVGRYEDKKSAFSLRDTLRELHPKEYSQCWINFIP